MNKYVHQVKYYETDRMGYAHHSNYLRWMEEARIELMDELGFGYEKMEEEGIVSPVTAANLKYRRSCTFPDNVHIALSVKNFNGIRLVMEYVMTFDDGDVICTAESEHCFLSENGRPLNMKKKNPGFYEAVLSLTDPERN